MYILTCRALICSASDGTFTSHDKNARSAVIIITHCITKITSITSVPFSKHRSEKILIMLINYQFVVH